MLFYFLRQSLAGYLGAADAEDELPRTPFQTHAITKLTAHCFQPRDAELLDETVTCARICHHRVGIAGRFPNGIDSIDSIDTVALTYSELNFDTGWFRPPRYGSSCSMFNFRAWTEGKATQRAGAT